jgi:uncharacterized membrane protein YfhO
MFFFFKKYEGEFNLNISSVRKYIRNNIWAFVAYYTGSFAAFFLISFFLAKALGGAEILPLIFASIAGFIGLYAMSVLISGHEEQYERLFATHRNLCVIASGLLSFAAIIMIYMHLGIYPAGEETVLIVDMHHQYVAFYASLRDNILSGEHLVYSDRLGLGGQYLSLFAYYLASPFTSVVLLFPRALLTEAIAVMTILKVVAAAVTFAIFFRGVFKKSGTEVITLSVAYSLMSYVLAYSWNLMWMDGIVVLPLVIYGLDRLLKGKNPAMYMFSLAAAVLSNYYIGYMICIYSVLYFAAWILLNSEGCKLIEQLKRLGRFAYASVLGGGMGAVLLIPTYTALMKTSGAGDEFARDLGTYFNLSDILTRTMFDVSPSIRGDSLPNVYCTVFAVLLIVIFFACKDIKLKTKLVWGGLLAFMVVTAAVNWTYFAWHGFHFPNDLPHRFSFLISFSMLIIAAYVLANIRSVSLKAVGFAAPALIFAVILIENITSEQTSFMMIYVSILFIILYAAVIALFCKGVIKKSFTAAILLLLVFTEVVSNGCVTATALNGNEYYTDRYDFTQDYDVTSAAVETVKSYGDIDYRMEFLPRKTCNDPSLFNYSGLTVFASSNTQSTITLMKYLGFANNGVNSHMYQSFVPYIDSILGLKYLVMNRDIGNTQSLPLLQTVYGDDDARFIYKNPYALSRAFVVDRGILAWDYSVNNPFDVQNSFAESSGSGGEIYTMVYPEAHEDVGGVTEYTDCFFSTTQQSGSDTSFTAKLTAEETGKHYIYVDCGAAKSIFITSGDNSWYGSTNEPFTIDMGTLEKGDTAFVKIDCKMSCVGNIFMARLSQENMVQSLETLAQNQLIIETMGGSNISGTVESIMDGIMFTTIPYDSGWTVTVDGTPAETYPIGDALLAFDITAGKHKVEMKYAPPALTAGIVISVLCLLAAIAVIVLHELMRKRGNAAVSAGKAGRAGTAAAKRGFTVHFNKHERQEKPREETENENPEGFENE